MEAEEDTDGAPAVKASEGEESLTSPCLLPLARPHRMRQRHRAKVVRSSMEHVSFLPLTARGDLFSFESDYITARTGPRLIRYLCLVLCGHCGFGWHQRLLPLHLSIKL